jgi:hypothetical protein
MATRPFVDSLPTISGSFLLGGSIARTPATWNGPGPISTDSAWYRCTDRHDTSTCSVIPSATGSNYTTTADDLGKFIRYGETANNLTGTSLTAYSDPAIGPIHNLSIPSNDNFASPTELPSLPDVSVNGSNLDATPELDDPLNSGANENSVWFKWTAPFTGPARIGICGADFDSVLGVYTGDSLASLTQVSTNDNGCPGLNGDSVLTVTVSAGTTYRILVNSYRQDISGAFTLKIENLTPAPPAGGGNSGGGAAQVNPLTIAVPIAKPSKLKTKIKKSAIKLPGTTLTCAAAATGPCTGTAALTVQTKLRKVKLTIKLSFRVGSSGSVVLSLSKSDAKKLAGMKNAAATAVLTVGAPGFAAQRATVKFTLSG